MSQYTLGMSAIDYVAELSFRPSASIDAGQPACQVTDTWWLFHNPVDDRFPHP